jgi:hypothetical protein
MYACLEDAFVLKMAYAYIAYLHLKIKIEAAN